MRKKIIAALVLSMAISASTSGGTSEPIVPLPKDHFSAIILPEPKETYIPLIIEPVRREVPAKPEINQPEPKSIAISKVARNPTVKLTGHSIKGLASWYCSPQKPVCRKGFPPGSYVAAAGPALRAAIGGDQSSPAYRNKVVQVCGSLGCKDVKLVDWCQCYWKQPNEKLLDLYKVVFDAVGASEGTVTVSW